MNLRKYVCLVSFVALCAPGLLAQRKIFAISAKRSTVVFKLGGVVHSVHGTFGIQSGNIQFDSDASLISGSIVVAAGSGESGNEKRDRRMTMDVLQAPKFTVASFTPQILDGLIAPSGKSTVQVTGIFTLHGSAHELTIPIEIDIDGANCKAKTSFLVPYVSWGLKDPSDLLLKVSKEVKIEITLVGQISAASKGKL